MFTQVAAPSLARLGRPDGQRLMGLVTFFQGTSWRAWLRRLPALALKSDLETVVPLIQFPCVYPAPINPRGPFQPRRSGGGVITTESPAQPLDNVILLQERGNRPAAAWEGKAIPGEKKNHGLSNLIWVVLQNSKMF